MGMTTVLRGLKVSVNTLDAFLSANGLSETYGVPPFFQDHPDKDSISILLHDKIRQVNSSAKRENFRVVMPHLEGHNSAVIAYVTYAWVPIWAHRELRLEEDLPHLPSDGFDKLKEEILSHSDMESNESLSLGEGEMGLFVVYTNGIRGLYTPQEYKDRQKVVLFLLLPSFLFQNHN